VSAIADRPSIHELDQLNEVMADAPLDRERVIDVLCGIEQGLLEHARGLDQAGGLLNDDEKAARMSLAREDERLRHEVSHLLREVSDVRRQANGNGNDEELRSRLAHILAGLRGHRDAEASLVLESVGTEVGSGD
jgi:hypothetical protein